MRALIQRLTPASVWSGLQFIKSEYQCFSFRQRQVEHTYSSFPLKVHISDPIAEQWYDHDCDRPEEFRLLRQSRLNPGARVFNLGAHQGILAMVLWKMVGHNGEVIAVEPLNVISPCRNATSP